MKRHCQTVGVRDWAGDDLVELQREPLSALDAFFAEYGPCIVQGCETAARADDSGTFDVSAGLVALEAEDPEGTRRVMTMPFPGASGVALPLYLTASVETLTDVYGDGKSKPIAYAYTARAVGVEPAEGTPFLSLTAEGGNRFVDAVQDPAHRFVSDAERARWDRVLEQAKAYADSVSATGSEAALRGAREYTDAREVAILATVDTKDESTLRTAKEYADRIVAALAGSAPETLDTLQELATALGNDPNFSATVMQMLGERVTTEALNEALAGRMPVVKAQEGRPEPNSFGVLTGLSGNFGAPLYGAPLLSFGAPGYEAQIILGGIGAWQGAWNRIYFRNRNGDSGAVSDWKEFYHSGNFDPATKMPLGDYTGDLNAVEGSGVFRLTGDQSNAPFSGSGTGSTLVQYKWDSRAAFQIYYRFLSNEVYMREKTGGFWGSWVKFYHSGNLTPATAASVGLMSAEDKRKLDGQPRMLWGSIAADGTRVRGGAFDSRKNGDYIEIIHNLGTIEYAVVATVHAESNSNRQDNYVSALSKGANICSMAVISGDGKNNIEAAAFDFVIYY